MRSLAWASIDTLCCLLLVILVLIAPPAEPPSVEQEGVYLLIVTWPNGQLEDVDTYVQVPDGEILYFANRNAGLAHLNRDDLGQTNDGNVTTNEERVVFRGTQPGEYIVNTHLYAGFRSTRVKLQLVKLRGADKVELVETVTLKRQGQEETAFRFTLNAAGDITGTSRLPRLLVGEVY